MKADITRDTFRPEKNYRQVIHQQGRVPLDADLNEAFAIEDHLRRVTSIDTIGVTGVPKGDAFRLAIAPGGKDLLVAPGRIYVDGILCELDTPATAVTSFPSTTTIEVASTSPGGVPLLAGDWIDVATATASATFQIADVDPETRTLTVSSTGASTIAGTGHVVRRRVSYTHQPHDPVPASITESEDGVPSLSLADGAYLAYVDVWLRHVTAIEDSALREVALGGPDTATRAQAVWQLRLRRVGDAHATIDCADALPAIPSPRGALAARAKLVPQASDPCIIDPIARYRRLSNQLYRVEIHTGGTLGDGSCSFKFSRDNGSIVVAWVPPAGPASTDKVVIEAPGRDAAMGFEADQWIELIDDTCELAGTPGTLVQIASVDGNVLSLKPGTATGSTDRADFPRNPRVRRWDQRSATRVVERPAGDDGWLLLEDGVVIRFEPGAYQAGDYWLIPARTINGDVEWPRDPVSGDALARGPQGVEHHYAAIALLDSDSSGIALRDHDCRVQFPPLTHICAEDVCVEGTPCGKAYKNVQEAIDDLCQARDLEFHNEHLHGWGVVCGLQVTCMRVEIATELELRRPRECVELANGYAIHPTGADIRIQNRDPRDGVVDLGQMILDAQLATRDNAGKLPDMSVSLWIDRDRSLHVEKYEPKQTKNQLLDGTIWMDFYHHCLESVVTWVKEQLQGGPNENDGELVTPAQKRLISLLNLFAQLLNPTTGRFVYISAKEDAILRKLYAGLRALLQSETFCGMFADIELPPYEIFKAELPDAAPRPSTIFGKGSHRRLRIDPDGKLAVTCGNGAAIHVYDLEKERLLSVTQFPSASARVVDVAFRKVLNTRQIIAVANLGKVEDKDSEIVVGTLADDGTITWTNSRVTCELLFVSLASFADDLTRVYGVARGDGIFVIQPDALPKQPERLGAAFAAAGHLVACTRRTDNGTRRMLVASGHASQAFPSTYTFMRALDVASPASPTDYQANGEGHDDVIAISDPENKVDGIFAVVGTGGARRLTRWTWDSAGPSQHVELLAETEIHLAYSSATGHILVTFEDSCQARAYRPTEAALKTDRHPLQLGAISAAARPNGSRFYVLNWLSNTITVIPADYVGPDGNRFLEPWQSAIDTAALARYRAAFINAFLKTAGRFVQYLKDCFCEQFLVQCPTPEGKKVYLADVSFKDGAVWQICNFGRRRYVHTFPTVEYWMSLVPVLPLIKTAVEKFCCKVIAGAFDKLAITENVKSDKVSLTMVRGAADMWKTFAVKDKLGTAKGQALLTGSLATRTIADKLRRPVTVEVAKPGLAATSIVGQPKNVAVDAMRERNISIGEVHTVDGQSASTLARLAVAPPQVPEGSNVDIYVDRSGKVLSYGYAPPATTGLADLRRDIDASRADASAGRADAAAARAEVTAALGARDARITELTKNLEVLTAANTAREAEVIALRTQLVQLQTTHDRALADMKTSFEELRRNVVIRPR